MTRSAAAAQAAVILRDVSVARVTLRDTHAQAREALAGWAARRATRPPRVMVVDDDPAALMYFQRALVVAGVVVVCEDDARTALHRMRGEAFDALLVDVLMPCMSGAELVEEVRRESMRPLLPIIAVSGAMDDPQVARACELAGANRLLAKPVSIETIADELAKLGVLERRANGTGTRR